MFGFIWHLPETSFPWQFRSPKDKHVRGQRVVYLILYAKYLQRFMWDSISHTASSYCLCKINKEQAENEGGGLEKQSAGKIFTHVKGVITPNRCVCPPGEIESNWRQRAVQSDVMRGDVMAPFRERSLGPSEINFLWRQKGKRKTFPKKLKPRWRKVLPFAGNFYLSPSQ